MLQHILITTGTLFTPSRQPGESSLFLALMQVENGFLCIRVQSSLVPDLRAINRLGGDYDVSDDLRIYQGGDEIILPEDAARELFEAVSDELLRFLLDVREARQKMIRPTYSPIFRVGNRIIRSEEEMATLSSPHRRRNDTRFNFCEASRIAFEGLKRNWQKNEDDPSLQPIKLWKKQEEYRSVKGFENHLFVALNGSKLNLHWAANSEPPPLSVSSAQTGMFSPVEWQQGKGCFLALQYIPELVSSLILAGHDWHVVLETLPDYEEYTASNQTMALALFATSQAPPELFTLLPNHRDEKKRLFPQGYLHRQAMIEAAKDLPSLIDKIGHLASMALCVEFSDQARLQVFQFVEKMAASKPQFKPKDANTTIFWQVGKNLLDWQEAGFIRSTSWFAETAFTAWHKQMEQYRDDDYDLLIDSYPPGELEEKAINLVEMLQGNMLIFKAQELVANVQGCLKASVQVLKGQVKSLVPSADFIEVCRPAFATMDAVSKKEKDALLLQPGSKIPVGQQFFINFRFVRQQGFYSILWFGKNDEGAILDCNVPFYQRMLTTDPKRIEESCGREALVFVESSVPLSFLDDLKEEEGDTLLVALEELYMQSDEIQQIEYRDYEVVADE